MQVWINFSNTSYSSGGLKCIYNKLSLADHQIIMTKLSMLNAVFIVTWKFQ